jgi:hypothetical protein
VTRPATQGVASSLQGVEPTRLAPREIRPARRGAELTPDNYLSRESKKDFARTSIRSEPTSGTHDG